MRTIRTRRRLTLRDVAERSGLSESFVSQLERGRANASIASLQKLTDALGTTLADLFMPGRGPGTRVLREHERPHLGYGILGRKYLLTPTPLEHLEVFIGRFDEGGSTGEPVAHGDSDELFLVMRGRFRLEVGSEVFVLETGDSVNYRSSSPHRAENIGQGRGDVMWVISPPSL
nr:XRE family transcriptional regulator [Conexibacter arvalis]